jgi:hypothetical protein
MSHSLRTFQLVITFASPLVIAVITTNCTPDIPEGRIACTEDSECPPTWVCIDDRCYSDGEGNDAGLDASLDTNGGDGGGAPCASDSDCSDEVFCNGIERCDATLGSADPVTGCAPPEGPRCLDSQVCDEDGDVCLSDCESSPDADADEHDAVACGGDDCDDANAEIHPGRAEVCDEVDDDCDPSTLGGTDTDADDHISYVCCNPDGAGGDVCGDDCDDSRDDVSPEADEVCDAVDNDCDTDTDEDVLVTFYADNDNDNYGVASSVMMACTAPTGHVAMSGDCADDDPARHPGASETCNLVDDDCDTTVDDGLTCTCIGTMTQPCGLDEGACMLGTQTCSGGSWGLCTGGVTPVGETCNNVDDDCNAMTDDGAAANSCAPLPQTTRTCTSGTCGYACTTNFQTCDSADPGDLTGCESNLTNDLNHCGNCSTRCTRETNVADTACVTSRCIITACAPGFGDCDLSSANGCETTVNTVTNCGSCGSVCPARANATSTCGGTSCSFTCNAGFSNCDGNAMNGCETPYGSCAIPAPRQIGPLNAMVVTSNRPELRFMPVAGTTQASVQVCSDPACASVVWMGSGTSPLTVGPPVLAPGRYYWRAFGRAGPTNGTTPSATWNFVVFATATPGVATDAFPYLNVAGGNEDLAIGDPSASGGGNVRFYDEGTSTVVQTISPPAGTVTFGSSISSVDVNGDGYGDLIVGACSGSSAPSTAPAGSNCSNRVFVYLGTAAGTFSDSTPFASLTVSGANGFGYSVAGLGDVNGDGYGDFAVGAYWASRAFVYLGGTSPSFTRYDLTGYISGSPYSGDGVTFGFFGFDVAAAGDVDGDHFDDILVGSATNNRDSFLFYGGSGAIGTAYTAISATSVSGADVSVSGMGDADGDGRADYARGRPGSLTGYYGTTTRPPFVTAMGNWQVTGPPEFGGSVVGPGDINGDGLGDVVVSSTGGATRLVRAYRGTSAFMWEVDRSSSTGFGLELGRLGLNGGTTAFVVVGTCWGAAGGCGGAVFSYHGASNPPLSGASWSGTGLFGAGLSR